MSTYKFYRWETFDRGEVWRIAPGISEYTNKFKQHRTRSIDYTSTWSASIPTTSRLLPIPDLTLLLIGYTK